jgi:phosphatidylserine/phosphatidylglycerophosphate/cardiolipin synthase-like enzyme
VLRALPLAAVTASCAVVVPPDDEHEPIPASFSSIGRHVITRLDEGHHGARDVTWAVSTDNTLAPDWIAQTPLGRFWGLPVSQLPVAQPCTGDPKCDPDFSLLRCEVQADCRYGGVCSDVAATVTTPSQRARRLCTGHSDAFYERIYDLLIDAHHTIEITSLGPPDGRFEAAIRNALTYLSNAGRSVRARYLWGSIPGASLVDVFPTTDEVLASLVRDVGGGSPIRVAVGEQRANLDSWNHTKVIAIDDRVAIVGGHNLMTRHYLQSAPAFDLSMQVTGTAARQLAGFAQTLWWHTCRGIPHLGATTSISAYPDRGAACDDPALIPPVPPPSGRIPMIMVGRLGALGDQAADDALIALVDSAGSLLRISQQDVGPVARGLPWPEDYIRALAAAAMRGVDIQLVVTNLGSSPDRLGASLALYSNGWTPEDVVQQVSDYVATHSELAAPGTDVNAILCAKLHIAGLRPSSDDLWPDGSTFANHAKLVVADDRAFYIGSQNWYPSNLTELGLIVDDADATHELVAEYFAPMWESSSRAAVASVDGQPCTP